MTNWTKWNNPHGRIQDFFLGGGALVSCSTSTPINHIVFFSQNTSCIRKPRVISGGMGAHPLHPPPRSAPDPVEEFTFNCGRVSSLEKDRDCQVKHVQAVCWEREDTTVYCPLSLWTWDFLGAEPKTSQSREGDVTWPIRNDDSARHSVAALFRTITSLFQHCCHKKPRCKHQPYKQRRSISE